MKKLIENEYLNTRKHRYSKDLDNGVFFCFFVGEGIITLNLFFGISRSCVCVVSPYILPDCFIENKKGLNKKE